MARSTAMEYRSFAVSMLHEQQGHQQGDDRRRQGRQAARLTLHGTAGSGRRSAPCIGLFPETFRIRKCRAAYSRLILSGQPALVGQIGADEAPLRCRGTYPRKRPWRSFRRLVMSRIDTRRPSAVVPRQASARIICIADMLLQLFRARCADNGDFTLLSRQACPGRVPEGKCGMLSKFHLQVPGSAHRSVPDLGKSWRQRGHSLQFPGHSLR